MSGRMGLGPILLAVAVAASCGKSESDHDSHPSAGAAGATAGGPVAAGGTGNGVGGAGGAVSGTGGAASGAGAAPSGAGGAASGAGGLGGSSGAAGCTRAEEVENSLSHCPPAPQRDGGQPTSSCGLEATCEALGCGRPWSDFDERGCLRPYCDGDDDCDADERCLPEELVGEVGCHSSIFEGCSPQCDGCGCGASSDCRSVAFCQPVSEFPESADCPVGGRPCEQLVEWRGALDAQSYAPELVIALEACAIKLDRAIAACTGEGGAAGDGGSTGTAGDDG